MCMVSNIGDGWAEQFPKKWPQFVPEIQPFQLPRDVLKDELESLRKEVKELKKLLLAAKKFDKATGQADCAMDEKVKLIKAIAKLVGVSMDDVFGGERKAVE